jgi:1-acyl-sn-glycerol-3-phosphate acyltransferase
MWCKHFVASAKFICGINYKIEGLEHIKLIDNTKPTIILSKHQSAWETVAFLGLLPQRLCFVFKRELLLIPFFGWVLGMLDMLHIDRKHGIRAFAYLSKQTAEKLKKGYVPILFPEGTRALPHQSIPYKSGGARLAIQNNANIIPISHNAGECWAKNSFIKKAGVINIHIGEPIPSNGKNMEVLNQEVRDYIETHIKYTNSI